MCRCLQLSLTRDDIKLTEISIRSKPASHLLQKYQRIELLSLSISLALSFARLLLVASGVLHGFFLLLPLDGVFVWHN